MGLGPEAKDAYLRSGWRALDLVLILAGWLPHLSALFTYNVSPLRVARCLRPLLFVTSLPGLQRAVRTLLNALPVRHCNSKPSHPPLTILAIPGPPCRRGEMWCYV